MKSFLAIALIGFLSFSNNDEKKDIVLEEFEINIVNLDYESELESIDLKYNHNSYLQNQICENTNNENKITLKAKDLNIPNYEYIEELAAVEFDV